MKPEIRFVHPAQDAWVHPVFPEPTVFASAGVAGDTAGTAGTLRTCVIRLDAVIFDSRRYRDGSGGHTHGEQIVIGQCEHGIVAVNWRDDAFNRTARLGDPAANGLLEWLARRWLAGRSP